MSDVAAPAPEFNDLADQLLAGMLTQPDGDTAPAAAPVPAPQPALAPEPAAPAPAAETPPAPEPAPHVPLPETGIRVDKAVRLTPKTDVDVRAATLAKTGMDLASAVDQARRELGLAPAPAPAPAAPQPVSQSSAPTVSEPAPESVAAQMEAIAAKMGELHSVIDAAEILELQQQSIRLQPALMQEMIQQQQSQATDMAAAEIVIQQNWNEACQFYQTLADESSPHRQAYEAEVERIKFSQDEQELALLNQPDFELLIATRTARVVGAAAFTPVSTAQPATTNPPGSSSLQQPAPAAQPRTVLPVVSGHAREDHSPNAGLRAPDPQQDLNQRLSQLSDPGDIADALFASISGGSSPANSMFSIA